MNQILKPARPERMGFDSGPVRETPITLRTLRDDIVEYDDGEPATIVSPDRQRVEQVIASEPGTGRREAARTSLGSIDRTMAVDYDDGNPATVTTNA